MKFLCIGNLQNMSCAFIFPAVHPELLPCFVLTVAAVSGVPYHFEESLWKLSMELGGAPEKKICSFWAS